MMTLFPSNMMQSKENIDPVRPLAMSSENNYSQVNNSVKKFFDNVWPSLYSYSEEAKGNSCEIKKNPFVQITRLSNAEINIATARARSPKKEPNSYLLSDDELPDLDMTTIKVSDENVDNDVLQRIVSFQQKLEDKFAPRDAQPNGPLQPTKVRELLTEMKAKWIEGSIEEGAECSKPKKSPLKQAWTKAFASSSKTGEKPFKIKSRPNPFERLQSRVESEERKGDGKRKHSESDSSSGNKRPKITQDIIDKQFEEKQKLHQNRLARKQYNHSSNRNLVQIPTDVLHTYTDKNPTTSTQHSTEESVEASSATSITQKAPAMASKLAPVIATPLSLSDVKRSKKLLMPTVSTQTAPTREANTKPEPVQTRSNHSQTKTVVVTGENYRLGMYESIAKNDQNLLSDLPEGCDPLDNLVKTMKVIKSLTEKVKQHKDNIESEREEIIRQVRAMYNKELHAIGEQIGKQETLFCNIMQAAMQNGDPKDEQSVSLRQEINDVMQVYWNHDGGKEIHPGVSAKSQTGDAAGSDDAITPVPASRVSTIPVDSPMSPASSIPDSPASPTPSNVDSSSLPIDSNSDPEHYKYVPFPPCIAAPESAASRSDSDTGTGVSSPSLADTLPTAIASPPDVTADQSLTHTISPASDLSQPPSYAEAVVSTQKVHATSAATDVSAGIQKPNPDPSKTTVTKQTVANKPRWLGIIAEANISNFGKSDRPGGAIACKRSTPCQSAETVPGPRTPVDNSGPSAANKFTGVHHEPKEATLLNKALTASRTMPAGQKGITTAPKTTSVPKPTPTVVTKVNEVPAANVSDPLKCWPKGWKQSSAGQRNAVPSQNTAAGGRQPAMAYGERGPPNLDASRRHVQIVAPPAQVRYRHPIPKQTSASQPRMPQLTPRQVSGNQTAGMHLQTLHSGSNTPPRLVLQRPAGMPVASPLQRIAPHPAPLQNNPYRQQNPGGQHYVPPHIRNNNVINQQSAQMPANLIPQPGCSYQPNVCRPPAPMLNRNRYTGTFCPNGQGQMAPSQNATTLVMVPQQQLTTQTNTQAMTPHTSQIPLYGQLAIPQHNFQQQYATVQTANQEQPNRNLHLFRPNVAACTVTNSTVREVSSSSVFSQTAAGIASRSPSPTDNFQSLKIQSVVGGVSENAFLQSTSNQQSLQTHGFAPGQSQTVNSSSISYGYEDSPNTANKPANQLHFNRPVKPLNSNTPIAPKPFQSSQHPTDTSNAGMFAKDREADVITVSNSDSDNWDDALRSVACFICGLEAQFTCCGPFRYCSKDCQQLDAVRHKDECTANT